MTSLLLFSRLVVASVEEQLNEAATTNQTLLWQPINGWVDGPTFRGTSSILWSSLITILASIYTAIHTDIVVRHTPKWQRFFIKIKWSLVALITPELMLRKAFVQYKQAKSLANDLRTIDKQRQTETVDLDGSSRIIDLEASKSRHTMAYGFWACMGGFVVDITNLRDPGDDRSQMALTAAGVKLLAEHGCFCDISAEEIADHSKANSLAKALVCAQIIWFLIQIFDKLIANYPLTLLEIHVSVHVVCALLIYGFWWHKPLDVATPIVIDMSKLETLMAFIIMASVPIEKAAWLSLTRGMDCEYLPRSSTPARPHQYDFNFKLLHGHSSELGLMIINTNMVFDDALGSHEQKAQALKDQIQCYDGSKIRVMSGQQHSSGFGVDSDCNIEVHPVVLYRWQLCATALVELGLVSQDHNGYVSGATTQESFSEHKALATTQNTHGMSFEEYADLVSDFFHGEYSSVAFAALPVLYGGLHLAAWNFEFPTPLEGTIWKVSATLIATFGAVLWLFNRTVLRLASLLGKCVRWLHGHFPELRMLQNKPKKPKAIPKFGSSAIDSRISDLYLITDSSGWLVALGLLIIYTACLAYLFCRVYLVVESFISLRQVPLGVFAITPWVQNLPHL